MKPSGKYLKMLKKRGFEVLDVPLGKCPFCGEEVYIYNRELPALGLGLKLMAIEGHTKDCYLWGKVKPSEGNEEMIKRLINEWNNRA